jgi:hypothetical protein
MQSLALVTPADCAPEPGRLGLGRAFGEYSEPVLGRVGVGEGAGAQQGAELLFDLPRGLRFAGRVIEVKDSPEPVPAAVREGFAGPEQQAPVGPDRVGGAAAPALEFLGQALADFGEHVVAEEHEVEGVHRDGGARQPHPRGLAERRRRIDRDDLHAEAPVQRARHSPIPLWSPPSTTPRTWPVSGSTTVDIHGSKRFQALVSGSWKNRTDR